MRERITKIDGSREADGPREKTYSIELSDQEYREKMEAQFGYKPPHIIENMNPELKKKFDKAKEITKENKIVKLKEDDKNDIKDCKPSRKTKRKGNGRSSLKQAD